MLVETNIWFRNLYFTSHSWKFSLCVHIIIKKKNCKTFVSIRPRRENYLGLLVWRRRLRLKHKVSPKTFSFKHSSEKKIKSSLLPSRFFFQQSLIENALLSYLEYMTLVSKNNYNILAMDEWWIRKCSLKKSKQNKKILLAISCS